ncbi:hypothetical protein [Psychroserpens sp. Hel_I_66]|uniref:hypothetical protein n=1 Tax=Psychroserpens sp. Hel_I_66 TaxID=1250004 RepID=UPI0006480114|nr:hypothetical protein [Psychroserpens sp. Hel_I_66]
MAPIKFEENIKNKLEKRTIQPSTGAWDKLSADLNQNDKSNRRGLFFYIGIAASIVGVLLVTTIIFNASENQPGEPKIVETQANDSKNKLESKELNEIPKVEVATVNSEDISEETKEKKESNQFKSSIKNEQNVASNSKKTIKTEDDLVIETPYSTNANNQEKLNKAVVENTTSSNRKEQSINTLTFEKAKVVEVVNEIKKLEIENGTVTDAEIENLLKQAEREILRERIYNETTRTVNADALLQDVEDDLQQSFRSKVFEGLKSSFKTVKSALVERNN